jgi:chromosome segregation ATPase
MFLTNYSHSLPLSSRSLAEELQRKDAQLAPLQNQLAQLTSDFKYNFKLLDERDAELEKQDRELKRLRTSTAEMAQELQEARREKGDWREEAERRQQRVEETEGALAAYQEVKWLYSDLFPVVFLASFFTRFEKGDSNPDLAWTGHPGYNKN